jgi:hypothetical protein
MVRTNSDTTRSLGPLRRIGESMRTRISEPPDSPKRTQDVDRLFNMRTPALALVLLMLTAACSGSPATTTTTPSTAPPTSSTAQVETTVATTTTVAPSTTTTTLPAPDTFLVAGSTCLLGWWDGDWQSEGEPPVLGGEEYQIVRLDEPVTTSIGTEPRPWCEPLELENIEFEPVLPGEWLDLDAIAVQTTGDVRPYSVEILPNSIPAYIDATAELLAAYVPPDPVINLTQVIRTDLEGDGVDEVIVAASSMPEDPLDTVEGNYSIVYLRKLVDGDVQTAILGRFVAEEPGPFNWVRYELSAVADLNGDGRMEIVIGGPVWEGSFLSAYEYMNDDLGPVEVLSCGCGA